MKLKQITVGMFLLPGLSFASPQPYAQQCTAPCAQAVTDAAGNQQTVIEPANYVFNIVQADPTTAVGAAFLASPPTGYFYTLNSSGALYTGEYGVTPTLTAAETAQLASLAANVPATVGQLSAETAARIAAAPAACASILPHDTLTGAVGSAAPCMPHLDATRPTIVQRARVALASGGTFSITWANATLFTSGNPVVQITPIAPSGSDIHCQIITTTNTAATGQCETTAASVSVLALGVVTVNSASASGTIVQLTAADPSQ